MRTWIVARTRMHGANRCVGALAEDGRSLRLLEATGTYPTIGVAYRVGEEWELEVTPAAEPEPPHLEDVLVMRRSRVRIVSDFRQFLRERVQPTRGGISDLFGGLLRFTGSSNGYICRRVGVPDHSTEFWIPDRDLVLRSDGRHYDHVGPLGTGGLAYVGEVPVRQRIEYGSLVRVSLARWWAPEDDRELRCYLQLSGWY